MLCILRKNPFQAFLALTFIGTASSFLVLGPNRIIRADNTIVKLQAKATVKEEISGILHLFIDWRMIGFYPHLCSHFFSLNSPTALLPMFFSCIFPYAYQGAINTARFDGPTRALNSTLSGAASIIGAILFGYIILDSKRFGRRTRGYIALAVVFALTVINRACTLRWQVSSLLGHRP